jgi:hypothetical protein
MTLIDDGFSGYIETPTDFPEKIPVFVYEETHAEGDNTTFHAWYCYAKWDRDDLKRYFGSNLTFPSAESENKLYEGMKNFLERYRKLSKNPNANFDFLGAGLEQKVVVKKPISESGMRTILKGIEDDV